MNIQVFLTFNRYVIFDVYVSSSKKWNSKPAFDEEGKPILQKNGKPVLRKSYSVLQDDFFQAMKNKGYDDLERGERGSSEGLHSLRLKKKKNA